MGLSQGIFQKLLFVVLFTLFITYIGFKNDFLQNLLVTSGLMLTSWLIVKVLLRFSRK